MSAMRRTIRASVLSLFFIFTNTHGAIGIEYFVTELPAGPNGINNLGQVVMNIGTWTPTVPNGTSGAVAGAGGVAINDYGQTVSYSGQQSFLFTPTVANGATGTTTVIATVDQTDFTSTRGISSDGAVTGEYNIGETVAIYWLPNSPNSASGQFDQAEVGDNFYNTGYGINAAHQLVGYAIDEQDRISGAFLFTPTSNNGIAFGTTTQLSGSVAVAINNAGQVVSNDTQAYLFTPNTPNGTAGTTAMLGTLPGATGADGVALNDIGQVVGTSGPSAFLWSSGSGMLNLNNLLDPASGNGWTLQHAVGINNLGQIVGTGLLNGVSESFLLTPMAVPEPTTITLAAMAFVVLLTRRVVSCRRM